MGTLTALAFSLVTPIFGFALAPPSLAALPLSVAPAAQIEASVSASTDGDSKADSKDGDSKADSKVETKVAEPAAGPSLSQDEYVTQLRKRAKIAKIHRTLGIATWALTGVAVVAGTIQYRNLYGVPLSTKLEDTPCVKGNAFPDQDQCSGTPWFHAITGFSAGALYFSTMSLAILMPDPDNASKGDSQFSKTLRMHKLLRWVHLAGMVSQMVIGTMIANPGLTGLDRANDYDTLKMLSGVHLATGFITLGALSYAGTIMLF